MNCSAPSFRAGRRAPRRFEQGIGLAGAIFVITVLALLAVVINDLVAQNAQTYQEEINLTRAFYAAESGAGIGMNTIFPPEEYPQYSSGVGSNAECAAGPRVYTFRADGLNNCTASVTCTFVTVSAVNYATVESAGVCGDVERTIRVRTSY